MDDARSPRTRTYLLLLAVLLLLSSSPTAEAGSKTTSFTHSVGFSFDYPTKWSIKRLQEGLMLTPSGVGRDAGGRPLELAVIGFAGVDGIVDPFDPSFPDAFEARYRAIVPQTRRVDEIDWVETPMGTGLVVPFEDTLGNRHTLYCMVRGELGIFLAHVTQGTLRPRTAKMKQVFSTFRWSDSVIDPQLARSWNTAEESDDLIAGRWTFAENGRFRHAESEAGEERGGFYSSHAGVLNVVWDHGTEESYLYSLSEPSSGRVQLELKTQSGTALRFH